MERAGWGENSPKRPRDQGKNMQGNCRKGTHMDVSRMSGQMEQDKVKGEKGHELHRSREDVTQDAELLREASKGGWTHISGWNFSCLPSRDSMTSLPCENTDSDHQSSD